MAKVTINQVELHVQQLGHGIPEAVFLHGLVMDNLSSWYFTVAPRVAEVSPVLLYDLRGHGRSARPESGYTVADFVDDLAGLLDDRLPPDHAVHLVGNSFGGLLALEFASRRPDRVKSLVLVDAHLNSAGWADQMVDTLSLTGTARDNAIATHFHNWLGRNSQRKRNRLAASAEALVYGTSLMDDLRRSDSLSATQLGSIRQPILALYGDGSDVLDTGLAAAKHLQNVRFKTLPGCSHSILWEATGTIRDEVLSWVKGRYEDLT
tara:strand:+ start:405 stop:1196 length:792 start_codon:yes stop_codon:yes gene_type:complete